MSDIPLILFAKAPIAGKVKTRLATHCSSQQCADIAQILLEITIQKAIEFWPGRVVLSVFLDPQHPFLKNMLEQYNLELSLQIDGDLGVKMAAALNDYGYPVAVMGCDVPQLPVDVLQQAHKVLARNEEVIGPAQDGGFYFLGVNQNSQDLLSKQKWGDDTVLQTTLTLAARYRRRFEQLTQLRDIDVWDDLVLASEQVPALKAYLDESMLLG